MKYLRHINEYNSDDYYIEISDKEYRNMIDSEKDIYFSQEEVNQIKKILRNEDFEYDECDEEDTINGRIDIENINKDDFTIYKISDEWYYIKHYMYTSVKKRNSDSTYKRDVYLKYYKCDQFEGLIECLKSIS